MIEAQAGFRAGMSTVDDIFVMHGLISHILNQDQMLYCAFRCQFCKGSLTKVHYPKLYNMAHLLAFNVLLLPKDLTIIFIYRFHESLRLCSEGKSLV